MVGQLEMQIFHVRKAAKIIDQLYLVRKEKFPEYQVILAPFYFKIGDALSSYVECNLDEMNQLKPLEVPEDPDDASLEEQEEDAVREEVLNESGQRDGEENQEDQKQNEVEPDDEPKIEDVIDSSSKPAAQNVQLPNGNEGGEGGGNNDANNEVEELSEDIFENFSLAIQIIEDFKSGYNL